jgi:hypothetical protein
VGDAADSMYIIISGKVGVYFPKPNYKDVKADERANTRIVSISEKEAKTLRMNAMLKEKGGWDNAGQGHPNMSTTEKAKFEHIRVTKETRQMLDELITHNKLKHSQVDNPLHEMTLSNNLKMNQGNYRELMSRGEINGMTKMIHRRAEAEN